MQDWNNRCDPPWPKDQLQKKVLNAALYATGERGTKLAASSFPRTESGDAEFFAAQFAGKVTYDARRSRWCLLDDDGLWNPDALEQVRNHALDAMRAMQRDALQLTDKADKAAAMKWAIQGEGTKRLNNLVREARTQPAIRVDSQTHPWDPNPWLLGVTGGVVDLRTGEGRKARPEERVTMRAGARYDPSARSPLWEQTLRDIFEENDGVINYVQRCAGYTLTGETREDKWFIAHGKNGREGKGTIYGAWAAAMGDYILELPSSALDLKNPKDYDLANLPGKRFVTSSESGNTIHLNHDRIKKLSGGDLLRAANKYQLSFEFLPSCKLWLACNDLPTVTDDSRAFWSRVIVIPFRRSFYGSENVGLRPALRGEGQHREAVLAWMVKGAMDYAREGLGPMPFAIAEATNAFRDESCP